MVAKLRRRGEVADEGYEVGGCQLIRRPLASLHEVGTRARETSPEAPVLDPGVSLVATRERVGTAALRTGQRSQGDSRRFKAVILKTPASVGPQIEICGLAQREPLGQNTVDLLTLGRIDVETPCQVAGGLAILGPGGIPVRLGCRIGQLSGGSRLEHQAVLAPIVQSLRRPCPDIEGRSVWDRESPHLG